MDEIEELEKRWKKYKRGQYFKRFSYLLIISLIALSAPVGYQKFKEYKIAQKEAQKREQDRNKTVNKEPIAKKDTAPPPEVVASIKPEKKKHIRPKLNIVVSNEPINGDDPSLTTNGIEFDKNINNKALAKTIESRFKDTKDYDDAMFLAKYYYAKRVFKRAEYWAMQANSIDSSQEDSWIIFAKSKAKQGKRADALRVLQAYFDRTGSMRVKNLIDRIRKGKKF
jgi:predicted Zn-dependent protease